MIIFGMIICASSVAFSLKYTKDIASPLVVSNGIWSFVYLLMLIFMPTEYRNSPYVLSFAGAAICFTIGFSIVCIRFKRKACAITSSISMNKRARNIILIICNVLAIYQFSVFLPYIVEGQSVFASMRIAQRVENVSTGISSAPLEIVFFVMLSIYLMNPTKENRMNLVLSLPCLFVLVFTSSTRGMWFYLLITVSFLIVYIRRVRNRRMIFVGLLGVVGILGIFAWSTYSFEHSTSTMSVDAILESVQNSFRSYFTLPAIAFVRWCEQAPQHYYGAYTFRFLFAILNRFYPGVLVVDTVMPFYIIDGLSGNVYTSLQWYASDFGVWWSLFVALVLGGIYGTLYKKSRGDNINLFVIIALSMLVFPIVNQFFDEKLFSIFSIWVQRFIFLYLMTIPNVCIKFDSIDNIKEKKKRRKKIRIVWGKL